MVDYISEIALPVEAELRKEAGLDIVQGSEEWLKLRLGIPTASRMGDLMAKTKTGYGAGRANYMAELIAEILTGEPAERFISSAMKWGTEHEAEAKSAYEFYTGYLTEVRSFVRHPTLNSGASPDMMVSEDGLAEFKCPNTATHIDTLLGAPVDDKYVKQMHWQMACTGRQWCDFVSYDPRMPEHLRMKIIRVNRDENLIKEMTSEVFKFIYEMGTKLDKLTQLK